MRHFLRIISIPSDSINTYSDFISFSKRYDLNSNLIPLIHLPPIISPSISANFKFQSDSINTVEGVDDYKIYITLNSNLILLIPNDLALFQLIDTYFKFQSDSINTRMGNTAWNFDGSIL